MEQVQPQNPFQELQADAAETPTLLELAQKGVPPGPELFKALKMGAKDYGRTPTADRSAWERMGDNLLARLGLQNPADVQLAELQNIIKQAYLPIYAKQRGEASLKDLQLAYGNLTPALGDRNATIEAGAPASGGLAIPGFPGQPPLSAIPTLPSAGLPGTTQPAIGPPASLQPQGVPLPPQGMASAINENGQSFNDFLATSSGNPSEYAAWQAQQAQGQPPEAVGGPDARMLTPMPPLIGMRQAQPPAAMLLNGAPPVPGQLEAMSRIHGTIPELSGLQAHMPVNLYDFMKTGRGTPAMVDKLLSVMSTSEENKTKLAAAQVEAQAKRDAAAFAAKSPMGQLIHDRDTLNPASPTYARDRVRIEIALDLKAEEHAKAVGTPTYQQKLKELGVTPGTESPAISKIARLSVTSDAETEFRFQQAIKAGDELAQQIAVRIGKEHPEKYGKKPTFLTDLDATDSHVASVEWARLRRESQPMNANDAGRVAMMTTAMQEISSVEKMLYKPDGTMDRILLAQAAFPGGGLWFTQGRQFKSTVRDMIGAKYRIETGAAGNQGEIDDLALRFTPTSGDSDATGHDKIARLKLFMGSALNLTDPGWVFRERAGMPKPDMASRYGELRDSGKSKEQAEKALRDEGYRP